MVASQSIIRVRGETEPPPHPLDPEWNESFRVWIFRDGATHIGLGKEDQGSLAVADAELLHKPYRATLGTIQKASNWPARRLIRNNSFTSREPWNKHKDVWVIVKKPKATTWTAASCSCWNVVLNTLHFLPVDVFDTVFLAQAAPEADWTAEVKSAGSFPCDLLSLTQLRSVISKQKETPTKHTHTR